MSLCMIVAPQNIHWVLDTIAKEIGSRYGEEVSYCYDLDNIPKADNYFVTHYSLLPKVFKVANPAYHKITCFFTHESVPIATLKDVMNLCHAIVCENQVEFNHLVDSGINSEILYIVVECADNIKFKPHQRTGKGAILVSSACYPRKNPDLVLNIMQSMPDNRFILIGKDWRESVFPSNVTYYDNISYENYPKLYSECDVYLSCSTLEGGGPGGLIESMHSNLFPVVSDTGNAREYITNNYNGFIFPINATSEQVVELIKSAYEMNPQESLPYNDVWQTIQFYNWESYARKMKSIINGDVYAENSI